MERLARALLPFVVAVLAWVGCARESPPRWPTVPTEPAPEVIEPPPEAVEPPPEAAPTPEPEAPPCASEANYSRCIIQRVPNPQNQRDLAAVAQAYSEKDNTARACQYMRRYVERYDDARARQFELYIEARCDPSGPE